MNLGVAARRALATATIFLVLCALVFGVIGAVKHFPRGLFVILLVAVAVGLGWQGVLRKGAVRVIALIAAAVLVAAAIVLLISRDPVDTVIVVVAAVAAVASARAAVSGRRIHLTQAPRPAHPVLIFNPRSGGGKATRFNLAEEARQRGIEPHEMTPGTGLVGQVEALLAGGADAVAVAGGDGSQALVAAVAARENVPFACIPAGTRNHFALDLGVDRDDVVGSLDAFVNGGERVVDLAEVNGRVFVNNVSVGLYGDAVQQSGYRDAKLKTLLDTLPEVAGPDAGTEALRWRDPDGFTHDGGIALLISNNVYRLGTIVGSGTRPSLDRGRLGISEIMPREGIGRGMVRRWSLPAMEIDGDKPVAVGIDGEAAEFDPPLRFVMRPAALRVRIAPQHPGCSPSAELPAGAWSGALMLVRFAFLGRR